MINLFDHAYPYLDEHELNLDWLIAKMKELKIEFDEFKVVNNITFSGQWDITKQYPAWTIVSDNNIGYVSLQPVPVGVVLTNGDYWVEVIDYTAQIAGLESRVIALEGDMLTVQGDITSINGQITNINNDLSLLMNRKFLFIGDSYDSTNRGTTGWSAKAASYLGLTLGTDYFKSSAGSKGFIGDTTQPGDQTFLGLLNAMDGVITDKDKITDIVVEGGCNDVKWAYTTYNDLVAAVATFITTAKSKYQNARIWIGCNGYEFTHEFAHHALELIEAYKTCVKSGAIYMNGLEYIMHNTKIGFGDGIHPNQNGEDLIGQATANLLTGKLWHTEYSFWTHVTSNTGWSLTWTNVGGTPLCWTLTDDNVSLLADNTFTINASTPFTLPDFNNYFAEVGILDDVCCRGNENGDLAVTIPAYVNTTSSQRYPVSLTIGFREGKLYITAVNMTGSSITNCNNFLVGRFNAIGRTLKN